MNKISNQDRTAGARLKALRLRTPLSMADMAKALGMPSASSYQYWEAEAKALFFTADRVHKLIPILVGQGDPPITKAEVLELSGLVPADSLKSLASPDRKSSRRSPQPDDGIEYQGAAYAALPIFDVAVSAGPGALNVDVPEPQGWHLFSVDALRSVTRAPSTSLAMVRVSGDSMASTLQNGDYILVDLSVRSIGRDGLYVIEAGRDVQVKRITRDWKTKTLTIGSDNPAYPPSIGVAEEDIRVFGRVVWLSRNIGG